MKTRRWILIVILAGAFGGSYVLKRSLSGPNAIQPGAARPAPRVVSLAPSITELLFALGLGEQVVGVTTFCTYPPEVRSKPKIGGYYDPNYEAIAKARPDLVFILPEHGEIRPELVKLGLNVQQVDHRNVQGILESVTRVGELCGAAGPAATLRSSLEARIKKVGERSGAGPKPRVLVSLGRMAGDDGMTRITGAGPGTFFDELIRLAGGSNAFEQGIAFPAISSEGLLALHPEVIIDLWPDLKEKGLDPEKIRQQWKALPGNAARIAIVGDNYAVVPGPRVILLLEDMARAIHPEAAHD